MYWKQMLIRYKTVVSHTEMKRKWPKIIYAKLQIESKTKKKHEKISYRVDLIQRLCED